jgi:pimeloyl-ACP methyl ester carboxylesterase
MLTPESAPLEIGLAGANSMEACRARVVGMVAARWPSPDPSRTIEVDVIGFSMGGVVARDAAIARPGEVRLNIVRLFTIASPHAGSSAADWPTLDGRVVAIRQGSEFLGRLKDEHEQHPSGYELLPYVRLGDEIVDVALTAPRGMTPWWVTNRPFELAHGAAHRDPRIIADIARRLRGEDGYATLPAAPLPPP